MRYFGADLPLPLSRLAECPKCRAYLHACRLCEFYDPRITSQCQEERAEEVRDKEHANFCDWFKPRPHAHRPRAETKTRAAKSELDALFGDRADAGGKTDSARARLDGLFDSNAKSKK